MRTIPVRESEPRSRERLLGKYNVAYCAVERRLNYKLSDRRQDRGSAEMSRQEFPAAVQLPGSGDGSYKILRQPLCQFHGSSKYAAADRPPINPNAVRAATKPEIRDDYLSLAFLLVTSGLRGFVDDQ